MKILHLLYESEGDSFGIGGVGVRAYEIYERLRDRHDVTLLCKKYRGARDGLIRGVRHLFVGAETGSLTVTLLSYAYGCNRFVRNRAGEYDIIVEEFSPAVPTFCHAVTAKPVVLQVQGHTGSLYFRKYNPLFAATLWLLERLRPRFYREFILISAQTAARIPLRRGGLVEVISNGINVSLFEAEPEDGDYILYLGRIEVYGKGLDLLLAAFERIQGLFPGVRLVVAGDGKDRERFASMVGRLPAAARARVSCAGWLSGRVKQEALSRAVFAVHPTRHDTQGISVLEAMASGKAVVVSDIPELSYVTACGGGVSFSTGDAGALARAMEGMMRNADRTRMGRRARDWARGLTWDRAAVRYENFLERVYNRHRSGDGSAAGEG